MNKKIRTDAKRSSAKPIALLVIGIFLLLNGFVNIMDDARVLTYDITSILSGIGFVLLSRIK